MKFPTTIFLSLFLAEAYAQGISDEIIYSNVIQVDNTSQEELHERARKWIAYQCDAITLDDADEIVGNGIVFLSQPYLADIRYTIKIKLKDNRFKYEIVHLRVRSRYQESGPVEYPLEDYVMIGKKKFDKVVGEQLEKKLIVVLDKAMKTPIDDNW